MRPADILGSTEVYTVDGRDYLGRTLLSGIHASLESSPALLRTKEAMDPESIRNIQFSSTRIRVVAKSNFLDLRL